MNYSVMFISVVTFVIAVSQASSSGVWSDLFLPELVCIPGFILGFVSMFLELDLFE